MIELVPFMETLVGVDLAVTVLILWRIAKLEKSNEKLQNDHIEIGKAVAVLTAQQKDIKSWLDIQN